MVGMDQSHSTRQNDLHINLKFDPEIYRLKSLLPFGSTKLRSTLTRGYYSRLNFSPYIISGAYQTLAVQDQDTLATVPVVKIGLTSIRYIDSDTMQPISGLVVGTTDFVLNLETGRLYSCETDLSDPIIATCEETSQT